MPAASPPSTSATPGLGASRACRGNFDLPAKARFFSSPPPHSRPRSGCLRASVCVSARSVPSCLPADVLRPASPIPEPGAAEEAAQAGTWSPNWPPSIATHPQALKDASACPAQNLRQIPARSLFPVWQESTKPGSAPEDALARFQGSRDSPASVPRLAASPPKLSAIPKAGFPPPHHHSRETRTSLESCQASCRLTREESRVEKRSPSGFLWWHRRQLPKAPGEI